MIVIRLILKENKVSVIKIVHLKVRNIIEEVLNVRNGYLNQNELWAINYLMSCNGAEWSYAVVERFMQDSSKYCISSEEIRFTCAVSSISSISSMTLTYMWSKGVHACSIHVTRAISFALVNICKIINIKKKKKNCNWEKVAEHNLRNLLVLSCGSRRKYFTIPLTRFFLDSPKSKSVVLYCKPIHQVSLWQWRFFTMHWMFT